MTGPTPATVRRAPLPVCILQSVKADPGTIISILVVALLISLPIRSQTLAVRILAIAGIPLVAALLLAQRRWSIEPLRRFLPAIGALLTACLISAALSLAPKYSLTEWLLQETAYFLVFGGVLLWAWGREDRHLLVLRTLAVSAFIVGVWTVIGYFTRLAVHEAFDSASQVYYRALGPYESYSRTAMFAIMAAPASFAVMVLAWPRRRWESIAAAAALAVLLWGTALTQTRWAWASCGLALLLTVVQLRRWLIIPLLALPPVAVLLSASIRTRITGMFRDLLNDPATFFSGRFDIWQVGFRAIRENPVFGIGYGPNIFLEDSVKEVYLLYNHVQQPDLHCLYLQQLASVGVAGVLAYLWLVVVLLRNWWRSSPWQKTPRSLGDLDAGRFISWTTGSILLALLFYGILGFHYEERNAFLTWIIAGVALAGARAADSK